MASTSESAKILLVDDEPVNRSVGSRMLSRLGYLVDVAGDAREAIELIGKKSYDIVFTDIQMPELSGLEALRLYREADQVEGRIRQVPLRVIALSGDDSELHRQEYLASGMDDMMGKPVRPDKLRAIIEKWMPQRTGSSGSNSPGTSSEAPSR